MRLRKLQRDWDDLGRTDPLWAVVTRRSKKGGRWEPEKFFKTGERKIADVMSTVDSLGVPLRRGRALDFGCGVGRLTQALASQFDEVVGVDIAPSMIEQAREFNQHGDRCTYVLNGSPHLKAFSDGEFDFVYSNITLQHMSPRHMRGYMEEFLRVLDLHGLAVFEITSRPSPAAQARRFVFRAGSFVLRRPLRMRMYWMRPAKVRAFMEQRGAVVIDIRHTQTKRGWPRYQYSVSPMKRSPSPDS